MLFLLFDFGFFVKGGSVFSIGINEKSVKVFVFRVIEVFVFRVIEVFAFRVNGGFNFAFAFNSAFAFEFAFVSEIVAQACTPMAPKMKKRATHTSMP